MDLLLNSDVSITFSWFSFLKNHLHLIFLLKSEMSLRKSTSLIKGVGENPNPLSNTFISNGGKVFWVKLKIYSEKEVPIMTIYKFTVGTRPSPQCLKSF